MQLRRQQTAMGRQLAGLGRLCAVGLLLGCGTESGSMRQGVPDGSECALANLTQACTCDGIGRGAQVCDGSTWSACSCTSGAGGISGAGAVGGTGGASGTGGTGGTGGGNLPPKGSVDFQVPDGVVFDWEPKTPFPDGTCEPGFYFGAFDGWYASPVIFQFPVPVVGDVNLTLGASVDGEVFEVSDGEVSGLVYGFIPFSATIDGSLDCESGTFSGTLENGMYNVGGAIYMFSGPLTASYNRRTHAFEMGEWMVEEPPPDPNNPPPTPPGGFGTWNATLTP